MEIFDSVEILYQDRDIKFDKVNIWKNLRNGEMIIFHCSNVEDTKGNANETGSLMATNLRLIWYQENRKKSNLSIGYNCISNINTRVVPGKSGQVSTCIALYIMAVASGTRFEFLFTDISTDLDNRNKQIFQEILDIYRLYQRSYLYRDLRLRGAIMLSGQLVLLPREQIVNRTQGVWNLSSDQGNLGCFVVTNIRIVWYADSNEIFNLSLPYIQIENIHLRESKYGPALVIKTAETAGSYILGFRIDPIERLKDTYQEFLVLYRVYTENPDLGVNKQAIPGLNSYSSNTFIRKMNSESSSREEKVESEIDDLQETEINSKLNTYLATGSWSSGDSSFNDSSNVPRPPVYCKELGFAMERIRDGYKLKDLWDVLPPNRIIVETEEEDSK